MFDDEVSVGEDAVLVGRCAAFRMELEEAIYIHLFAEMAGNSPH